jgi:hypothetical protein
MQLPPIVGHMLPPLVQNWLTQHPFELHWLPAQQASPAPPHWVQSPLAQA